jgi:hypothetical protein
MRRSFDSLLGLSIAAVLCFGVAPIFAQTVGSVLEGRAAFGDWRADRPGLRRVIKPHDLPPPEPAESVANRVSVAHRLFPPALPSICLPPGSPRRG